MEPKIWKEFIEDYKNGLFPAEQTHFRYYPTDGHKEKGESFAWWAHKDFVEKAIKLTDTQQSFLNSLSTK